MKYIFLFPKLLKKAEGKCCFWFVHSVHHTCLFRQYLMVEFWKLPEITCFESERSGSVGRGVDCGSKVFNFESHCWRSHCCVLEQDTLSAY